MQEKQSATEPNPSTTSTKRHILIKPETEKDLEDFIYISQYPAGKKFRDALTRLTFNNKYDFSYNDYKRNRVMITFDFAAFKEKPEQWYKNTQKGQAKKA